MAKRRNSSPYRVARPAHTLVRFLRQLSEEFGWDAGQFFDAKGVAKGFGLDDLPDTDDPSVFFVEYLRGQLMSKYDDGKSSDAKKEAAMEKFREAEILCVESSVRLRDRGVNILPFTSADAMLHRACRKIETVLGDFSWDEASDDFGFGPGATARLPRHKATLPNKLTGVPVATDNMRSIVSSLCEMYPMWDSDLELSSTQFIVGNRITTVPKNYKTDRTIAAEPDLNAFVQRGIGRMIRRRLKAVGVDLDDQSRNRYLARKGSIDGSLATIDLSMASDTVSLCLVDHLLPPGWFSAIEQTRSPAGVLPDGTEILYQKVSSMGNGYTFELESLIFWAVTSTVVEILELEDRTIGIYGDDIIVATAAARPLLDVLNWLGFRSNVKKSHFTGYFRESCGGHYFRGRDVTPFYIRSLLKEFTDVFLLHNNLYRWSARYIDGYRWSGPTGRIPEIALCLRSAVGGGRWNQPRICDGLGDGAFIGDFSEVCPVSVRSDDYQRTRFRLEILGRFSRSAAGPFGPAILRSAIFSRDSGRDLRTPIVRQQDSLAERTDGRGPLRVYGGHVSRGIFRETAHCWWPIHLLAELDTARPHDTVREQALSTCSREHPAIAENLNRAWLRGFRPLQPIDTRTSNPHEVPLTRKSILVDRWADLGPWL